MKEEKDNKPSILSIIALTLAIISLIWSLTNAKLFDDLLDTQVQVVQTLDKQNKKFDKEILDLADCVSDTVKNLPYKAEVTVRGDTYKVELYTLNNKDGSKTVENQKFTEVASVEGSQEGDVESYDILITYGDLIIEKIHIINEECFTLSSDFDIDDDGSVLVPFEVVLPEGAIFKSFTSYLNNNEVTFEDTTGTLKFDKLDTNTVSISGYLEYEYNGISFERNIYIENFDLGVDLRVSYYAPHLLSSYQYMDLKFEAYIKDKLVNFNFDPAFYNSDDEEMSFSPNEDIYRVSFDGNEIKYDLSSDGFEIDSLDLTNFDSDVCNSSNFDYDINFEKYTINNPVN